MSLLAQEVILWIWRTQSRVSLISTPRYGWDATVVMADPPMGYMFWQILVNMNNLLTLTYYNYYI